MSTTVAHRAPPSIYDLDAYDYDLPRGAIAQVPCPRRDEARLFVIERGTDERRHLQVKDLPQVLRAGDLLVLNDTRVIAARLRGVTATGARCEVLLVRPSTQGSWIAIAKPTKRLKVGRAVQWMTRAGGADGPYSALVKANQDAHVELEFGAPIEEILAHCGEMPLPPYIHREKGSGAADVERYQTVYARVPGAIAAPTAGLHFTPELLEALRDAGVERTAITLHVGPGTFQPVRGDDVREHQMEAEWAEIPPAAAEAIANAKREGRRVIAVGTTTTRALESLAVEGRVVTRSGWADCFIVPGYRFAVIDGLLTNFHLPRSTLLMLVAALAGRERILDVYRDAVERSYRFYSYGDASLIL